ncbi:MAG: hypothetical protein ACRD07_07915 [Acidimicrobiales bacterium]
MTSRTHDIPALAAEFTAAHLTHGAAEQRLVLALFRLLGEGTPFGARELAERVGRPLDEVASDLDRLPMVQRDDQGRVVASAA